MISLNTRKNLYSLIIILYNFYGILIKDIRLSEIFYNEEAFKKLYRYIIVIYNKY